VTNITRDYYQSVNTVHMSCHGLQLSITDYKLLSN